MTVPLPGLNGFVAKLYKFLPKPELPVSQWSPRVPLPVVCGLSRSPLLSDLSSLLYQSLCRAVGLCARFPRSSYGEARRAATYQALSWGQATLPAAPASSLRGVAVVSGGILGSLAAAELCAPSPVSREL